MNRRAFLTSVAASAALAAPIQLRASTPRRRIPMGFLGVSYSHGPAKLELAIRSPDWDFVGVCDPSPSARSLCEKVGTRVISADELLAKAEVVAVESDISDHAQHALTVLKAGRHLHLEKTPVTRLSEMQEIVSIAREKKLLVQVGYMWRYHPGFLAILEATRAGWLGDVHLVRGSISNFLAPERRHEWARYPGGAMFELGSHLVDATARLLGRSNRVTPFLARHGRHDDGLKDNNLAVLEYASAWAIISNTALQTSSTPPRSFEVTGSRGSAALAPIEPGRLVIDLVEAAGPYGKGRQEVTLRPYRRYEDDFVELAAAVRGEKLLSLSLEEELVSTEMILRASGMA